MDNTKIDKDLQEALLVEQQKAKFQNQVHLFTDTCWEKCIDKPASKLDSRTETCIINCVERFIDTSVFMANRFGQKATNM